VSAVTITIDRCMVYVRSVMANDVSSFVALDDKNACCGSLDPTRCSRHTRHGKTQSIEVLQPAEQPTSGSGSVKDIRAGPGLFPCASGRRHILSRNGSATVARCHFAGNSAHEGGTSFVYDLTLATVKVRNPVRYSVDTRSRWAELPRSRPSWEGGSPGR